MCKHTLQIGAKPEHCTQCIGVKVDRVKLLDVPEPIVHVKPSKSQQINAMDRRAAGLLNVAGEGRRTRGKNAHHVSTYKRRAA